MRPDIGIDGAGLARDLGPVRDVSRTGPNRATYSTVDDAADAVRAR